MMDFETEDLPGPEQFPRPIRIMDAGFRWGCQNGRVLQIHEMETTHLFNTMKMIFNHLTEAFGNCEPVWPTRVYEGFLEICREQGKPPKTLAKTVLYLQYHLERRNNLPLHLQRPFQQIKDQTRKNWPKLTERFFSWEDTLLDGDT
jgi:hypothetical protein